MSMDRETLEQLALEAVPASDYYELLDCIGETPSNELLKIISLEK